MWSWSKKTEGLESEFCSYDRNVRVFVVTDSPYGVDVYVRRTWVKNQVEYEIEKKERGEYEGVRHEMILESLETGEEQQLDGSIYLFAVYPRLMPNLEEEIQSRNQRTPQGYYVEDEMWTLIKRLISFHAFLQSKVTITQEIATRGVKPQDIFLLKDGSIKIADWGFGTEIDMSRNLNAMLPFACPALRRSFILGVKDVRDAQYNRYKSNVFSLGICLLSLITLDIPTFITSLKDLQKNIDKRLNGAFQYSPNVAKAVRKMAFVDESERLDFLQLENEICKPVIPFVANSFSTVTFGDDDKLPPNTSNFIRPFVPVTLSMNFALEYIRLDKNVYEEDAAYILTLQAAPTVSTRCGLDLVCVLDLCSSKHISLPLLQSGLHFLLSNLTSNDRLSLVSFGKQGSKLCRLTLCTDANKLELAAIIDRLTLEEGSNVSNGLIVGLQAVKERREKNGLAAVLLFTNGVNERDPDNRKMCVEALMAVHFDQGMTVHSFVMQERAEYAMLSSLSREAKGALHLCYNPNSFQTALGLTIGSLTSVVARNIEIRPAQFTDSFPCRTDHMYSEAGTLPILVPYMSAGQTLEFAFTLKASSLITDKSYYQVASRYEVKCQGNSNEEISIQATLPVWVIPWATADKPNANPMILLSFYSKKVATAIRDSLKLARERKFTEATYLLANEIEELTNKAKKMGENGSAGEKLLKYLEKAMKLESMFDKFTEKEAIQLERICAGLFCHVATLETLEHKTPVQERCVAAAKEKISNSDKLIASAKSLPATPGKPQKPIEAQMEVTQEELTAKTNTPKLSPGAVNPEPIILSPAIVERNTSQVSPKVTDSEPMVISPAPMDNTRVVKRKKVEPSQNYSQPQSQQPVKRRKIKSTRNTHRSS